MANDVEASEGTDQSPVREIVQPFVDAARASRPL